MNEKEIAAGLAPTANYRYADVVGDQLFVAGQVPHDGRGDLVGSGEPGAQAVCCLDNLRRVVELHGFSISDVRFITVSVVGEHQNLLDAWSAVSRWFDDEVPPATLVGVSLLGHSDQLVEIDATILRSSSP